MTKKEKKANGIRIERAYGRACQGVLVSVLDLGKVYKAGEQAIASGADDAALELALRAEAEKYRVHDKHA